MNSVAGVVFLVSMMVVARGAGQERTTHREGDVSVTLPAGESDLADEFLKLARSWRTALQREKSPAAILEGYVLDPRAAQNSMRRIAAFTGLGEPDEVMRSDWKKVAEAGARAVECWRSWETGFREIHCWTPAEAGEFLRRDQHVFSDVRVLAGPEKFSFSVRPGFLPLRIDLDRIPEPGRVVPHRLDLVLSYRPGTPVKEIVAPYRRGLRDLLTKRETFIAAQPAADLFRAMWEGVCRRTCARIVVNQEPDGIWCDSLSLAFSGAMEESQRAGGRADYFGRLLRSALEKEWNSEVGTIVRRMRETSLEPDPADGHIEKECRRLALAMIFLGLENAGDSLNGWVGALDGPLDPEVFVDRLNEAAGPPGLEEKFRSNGESLARQVEAEYAGKEERREESRLSSIEENWPRVRSGRVEIIHAPLLEDVATAAAPRLDGVLSETGTEQKPRVKPMETGHLDFLRAHGLKPREESVEGWESLIDELVAARSGRVRVRLWSAPPVREVLAAGTAIPGAEMDPATGEVSFRASVFGTRTETSGKVSRQETVISLFLLGPGDLAERSPEEAAAGLERQFRGQWERISRGLARGSDTRSLFFLATHEVVEEALVRDVIRSADRRWFCDGFANWMATRLCDEVFGEGAGHRVFEELYPPKRYEELRESVDLGGWSAAEDGRELREETAHYYFATLAIEEALKGRGAEFVRDFLDSVRETPLRRANMETVYRAFRETGAGDLEFIRNGVTGRGR